MRSSNLIFIVGLLFILLTDSIFWYQLKQYLRKKWQTLLYCLHSLIFITALVGFQLSVTRIKGPEAYFWFGTLIGLLFLFYLPKLIYILLNGTGNLFRKCCHFLSRCLKGIAAVLAIFIFLFLLYSISWGRYNYKIETVGVHLDNLPAAFQNYKIVQLSDIHLGSYGKNYKGIKKMVEEVNRLHPDLIVFTGDMVNNFATEMSPWIQTMAELKAVDGKYAVTGNHDYGDYTRWPDARQKQENMQQFFRNMKAMGFHMLNNDHIPLVSGQDTLWLAGVENWGKPPFPRYGKLSEALDSLAGRITILLSHDPSHWRAEVLEHPDIALTLSGHTHAMQMGIKIGHKEWSPASYLYPEYDGLYKNDQQYLYVSRGQGYLGFPGRVGLRPVITELILNPKE